MRVLVTGAAGFIGFHLSQKLLKAGHQVMGYDSMSSYYDPSLKKARAKILSSNARFDLEVATLENSERLGEVYQDLQPDVVVHLAAQAGVRYSIEAPDSYISSNLIGTYNLLETMRKAPPAHFLMSSTSSVYGGNVDVPFRERERADHPVSLYAATKKACEALSHSYSHLYKIPTTCFRFFTVYGPWGRPDMALFKFVSAILEDRAIDVYGHGNMRRDFTYIDDLVEAVDKLIGCIPEPSADNGGSPVAAFRVLNIGGGAPTGLLEFIDAIEAKLGVVARKNFMDMQPGDVVETYADPSALRELIGYVPTTSVGDGVSKFVDWYRDYYAQTAS